MLPVVVLQAFAVGASAAALSFPSFTIQNPFDIIFGDEPWKHWPTPHPSPESMTVYETITNDDRFKCLSKAIEFGGNEIISVLNNKDTNITFFAVPDTALKHGHDFHDDHGVQYESLITTAFPGAPFQREDMLSVFGTASPDIRTILNAIDAIDENPPLGPKNKGKGGDDDGDDGDDDDGDGDHDEPDDPDHGDPDRDKERRKKMIKYIVNAVLQYHVLPYEVNADDLRYNTTYRTNLKIPVAFGGHSQRVRVFNKYKKKKVQTFLNGRSKVVVSNVKAKNGLIHVVDHPIIPPGPVFQELFLFPHFFSTFTSALQRSGLADELDLRYIWNHDEDEGHFEGTAAVTVFAVPNKVFDELPRRLQWFLFSPFGKDALRKVLEYHIVPGVIAHSDFVYNQTAETNPDAKRCSCDPHALKKHHPYREPISSLTVDLDTRFTNHSLNFHVEKDKLWYKKSKRPTEYETTVFINGDKVKFADIVGLNGAIHIVDKLLCPWHHNGDDDHHHHHGMEPDSEAWKTWEEWLPQMTAGHDGYSKV